MTGTRFNRPVIYLNSKINYITGITIRVYQLLAVILADGSVDFGARYTISFTEDPDLVNRFVKEFRNVENFQIEWKVEKSQTLQEHVHTENH